MPGFDRAPVKLALCVAPGELRDAAERAVHRSGGFELVGVAANASELAGLVHTYLPDVAVVDDRLGDGDVVSMLARATTGRPLVALVLVEDESTERRLGRQSPANLSFLARPTLLTPGLAARSHVSHCLTELGQDCAGTAKNTIPTDLLVETVERRQSLAGRAGIRQQLITLGTWPLDLIVLVGGHGNDQLLPQMVARLTSLAVPVLVALRPYAALPAAIWSASKLPVTHLTQDIPLRKAEGFVVAPRTGSVRFSPDTIRVLPGNDPLLIVDLVRSTGALQSGALTVQLGDGETDCATALAAALDAGAAGAVLDPAATPYPAGPQAALSWSQGLVTLKLSELSWLLGNAAPRRT